MSDRRRNLGGMNMKILKICLTLGLVFMCGLALGLTTSQHDILMKLENIRNTSVNLHKINNLPPKLTTEHNDTARSINQLIGSLQS